MTAIARLTVYLRLGRVSNLPTVWTNVLTGVVVTGTPPDPTTISVLVIALSLFYVAGMFLNDAFDRHHDARARPERPIPAGLISAAEVFSGGFSLLAAGVALVGGWAFHLHGGGGWPAVLAALSLSVAIVVYNVWHKSNPASPLVMGACRVLVYVTAAATASGTVPSAAWLAGAGLLSYLVGLTWVARQEDRGHIARAWPVVLLAAPLGVALTAPDQPLILVPAIAFAAWMVHALLLIRRGGAHMGQAVAALIAGISLVDALFLVSAGWPTAAALAVVAGGVTLLLQRYIRGT
jgi:4-hydroxybenzoate polyprenyltransferase